MQRTIILTGSNGLLGQKIVPLLAGRPPHRLIATGRGPNRLPFREGYTYVDLDLLDENGWEDLFAKEQPTDVIHTAAATQVDWCEGAHEKCDAVNIEAVARLVERCKRYGTHLVHISTDFVFDGADGPYQETDTPNPVNYYGQSKLRAEQIIQESGISAAILRTMLLYGITPAMSRSNIVLWVKSSLEKEQAIRVVGDQVRCPTLVEDLAIASVQAMMQRAKGVYHISGAEMMSIIELARKVADFWKLDASLIAEIDSASLNQAAKRPPKTGFILLKAQTELNYKPHSLEEGLQMVSRQMRELANGQ
ncbi:MAG: SDR family oxidoreductase [Bacteroidota bacterium]